MSPPDTTPLTDTPESMIAAAAEAQRRASDPDASVWVGASAGTGKTKVLTDRVLSLLLDGTPPARVLCLTFTKAAAAEMANRLADRLAKWATIPDAELDAQLTDLLGRAPDDAERRRARQLFARVLDTPGRMKIQTLHAFCQSILGRFPLEAGISPQSTVLDETSAAELLRDAREAVLAHAGAGADPDLTDALARVTALAGEDAFVRLIDHVLAERGRVGRALAEGGGIAGMADRVYAALGVDSDETRESLLRAGCADGAFDADGLEGALNALLQGTAKEREAKAPILRDWLHADAATRVARFDGYTELFLTQKGEVRKNLLTKGAAAVPGAAEAMAAEAERIVALRDRMNAADIAQGTVALLRLGAAILDAYEQRKRARAQLDYDDLILATQRLLEQPDVAGWVLFKLDGGLDHVLIDEGQDTNPDQWRVVDLLTSEFFAGEGAAEAAGRGTRTVFAVGDVKQSIYSFQRADPYAFDRMRRHFAERVRAAQQRWEPVDLHVSFRSTDAVLRAVDSVFAQVDARDGVVIAEGDDVRHAPVRQGDAGLVEVWPPVAPEEPRESAPWEPPVARGGAPPPAERLARLIAVRIHAWTKGGDPNGWLDARGRQMQPGDVLILVRRRDAFMTAVVRELKALDVPVAGVDRMVLTEQLAVRDLIALGQVLLLPEDDLTLASVLKGPLIGLGEDDLFDLCYGRPGRLWDALRDRAGERAAFETAYQRLSDWMARADAVPPYELFGRLLGADGGRRDILARLGPDAADPLDEFLALALAYEREHVPSLQGFLHWLEAGAQEVKRNPEHGSDAVRVMTVHGAKGLQAPVVFLPDTIRGQPHGADLFWSDAHDSLFWSASKARDVAPVTDLRAAAERVRDQESRRLLYVAMTRAEDRLYVAGWQGRRTPGGGPTWHDLIAGGLADVAETVPFDVTGEIAHGWRGEALRLATPQRRAPEGHAEAGPAPAATRALPEWARREPPREPAPPRPLAPSRAPEAEPPVRSPLDADAGDRFRRGRIIHRLLQALPDLPPEERRSAGERLLASPLYDLDAATRAALLDEVLGVIDAPELAELFGPDSRAEVPVVGLGDGREPVSGQIDRMLVRPDKVIVIDYKTNRPPPATPEQVPEVYRRQMRAYRDLLAGVYPDRAIETWLLWTDSLQLMAIDAPARDDGSG